MDKKIILALSLILLVFIIPSLVFAENIVKGPFDWPMSPGGPRVELSKNNWGVAYTKDKNWFANVNGETYGPYEKVYVSISDNVWGMSYREIGGKSFANINGKIYGPYADTRVTTSNNNWLLEYKDGDKWYVNINDKKYGPCDSPLGFSIGEVSIAENSWAFECEKGEQFFAMINEKEYGPYDSIHDILTLKNYWQYRYEKDGQDFLNTNGKIQELPGEFLTNSDSLGFIYRSNDKRFINIKGNIFGPYDFFGASVIADTNWGFEYGFKNNTDANSYVSYVNINNKIYGPYDSVYGLGIAGDNFGFKYSKGNKAYIVINDKEYGPFDFGNVSVSEKSWGFSYSQDGKTYVNFMGTEYGPYDSEYEVIYVSDNNWKMDSSKDTSFSGGSKSTIINGNIFGPYENVEAFIGSDRWAFNYQEKGKWYIALSEYIANNDGQVSNAVEDNKNIANENDQSDKIKENNKPQNNFANISKYLLIIFPVAVMLLGGIGFLVYKKNKNRTDMDIK